MLQPARAKTGITSSRKESGAGVLAIPLGPAAGAGSESFVLGFRMSIASLGNELFTSWQPFASIRGGGIEQVAIFLEPVGTTQVRLVAVGGKLLEPSKLGDLAKMPTREQALSMLLATMKAPVQKLAATINEVPGKLVRTLAAIRDAKEAA
jgi:hypothetical protein